MRGTKNLPVLSPAHGAENMAGHRGAAGTRRRCATGVLSVGLLAGVCLFVGTAPAQAATGVSTTGGILRVQAASGKANNITVSVVNVPLQGQRYKVRDTGDSLTAGAGCDQITSSTVYCSPNNVTLARVNAGDGNDTVTLTANVPVPAEVNGGSDNDTVTGGSATDDLRGDDGRDVLNGGGGNDDLFGGGGNDRLIGNAGNDRLWGGVDHDLLYGEAGNDTMNGEAGNDRLWGNEGIDTLNGGAGNDDALDGGAGQRCRLRGSG